MTLLLLAAVGTVALIAVVAVAGGVVIRRSDDKILRSIGYGLVSVYGSLALLYAALTLLVLLPSGSGNGQLETRSCSEFPSQTAAQIFYDEMRSQGSPGWEGLTVDERGIVCEGSTFIDVSMYTLRVGDTIFVYERAR